MLNLPKRIRPAPVALPLATVLAFILPLTTACSSRGQQASSPPAQATETSQQEPVEQGTGDGDMTSPLPAGEGSSAAVHQDNPTSRDNDSVVHSDLYNAVANGHTEVVDTLIAAMRKGGNFDGYYGWDMNTVGVEDAKANTLLHVAAANGHGEVANLLLQAGAAVNAQNNDNNTPTDLARQHGHESLAQRLERIPELLEAAAAGNVAQVETLLAAGVYVNAHGPGRGLGPTPLHHAAEKGYAHMARLLVEAGANVNARVPEDFYNTPLHLAAHGGHAAVVKLLIEAGAGLDKQAEGGSTPLLLATGNERREPEAIRLLLRAGLIPISPIATAERRCSGW